ncbi:MAG: hypothetical protein IJD78_07215 [Clostridia bacterium]|nr:hypothetical protein [Clostridia bacterium]MBQ3044343.1 hypothetical protein [Clostridia bacterium]
METQNVFAFLAISMITMCFGWGMRGSAIGGEKGAMLPGAFIGILCVWYTGSELLMDNVYLFAAACALGYFYGGMEPYGSTMGLVLDHDSPRYNPSLGYLALAFKGSIWSGLGSAFLGMSFSAMSGVVYKWYDFVIFFALVPLVQEIGYRIFNTPYDPEHGKMPKICFSKDSREEWGRNLVIVAGVLVMAAIRRDIFTIIMWVGGALAGSIGWVVAITFYDKELHPLKNGKMLFGKWEKLKIVDGWKIMEFTQGCFNGLGIAGAFVLGWPLAAKNLEQAEATGKLWYMLPEKVDITLSWVFCALIILTIFLFIIPYRRNGNKITRAFGEVDMNIVEVLERPCYMVGPLCLVMLGSTTMASIICCFTMYYVIAQHDGLERYWDYKNIKLIRIFLILLGAAILAGQILRGYTLWETWIFYCVGYILFDLAYFARPKRLKENKEKSKSLKEFIVSFGGDATVLPFFYVLMIGLLVFGYVNFR